MWQADGSVFYLVVSLLVVCMELYGQQHGSMSSTSVSSCDLVYVRMLSLQQGVEWRRCFLCAVAIRLSRLFHHLFLVLPYVVYMVCVF